MNQHSECAHEQLIVKLSCEACDEQFDSRNIRREDLSGQELTELPDREAMSLVNANVAIPINLAAALNILSDGSAAGAGAAQTAPINQGMGGTPPVLG